MSLLLLLQPGILTADVPTLSYAPPGELPFSLERADLNIKFQLTDGLAALPDVRGQDQVIPFRTGRLPGRRTVDRRTLIATGWVAGTSGTTAATSYLAYLDALKRVLDPTKPAGILTVPMGNSTSRWIPAIPRNTIGGVPWGYPPELTPLSIEWEALDPYWYGGRIVIAVAGGTAVVDTMSTAEIENGVLAIQGPATNPGISVTLPDGSIVGFTMALTLSATETLFVDNARRTVLLGGVSMRSAMTLLADNRHGEYFRLAAGLNTLTTVGSPAEVRVTFTTTFL